ncbi:phosphodiester glycosidase family protein [Spirulina sp. 06S082]|uniref:phosphodiester glycosidase family protein n=1 Tax=Spirulina sp. 06S082 TaxID=3110248 RepID=UPI002B1FE113|nr:phosphodiester glycosidase family protein [Spirulina sp. 06S082]MEA5468145.1 phosphodiester glycosidase family protein [Spirulina sp. 06S082]
MIGTIVLTYGVLLLRRSPRSPYQEQLFQGISYQRIPYSQPRPFLVHVVTIDLTVAGVQVLVTPGSPAKDGKEFNAQTTGDFLKTQQLQLAINGSYFQPFYTKHPLDFYPKSGDRVNVLGQSISDGIAYSSPQGGWNVLCFSPQNRATIESDRCPSDTLQGLAGGYILILEGKPARQYQGRELTDLYPRMAVGVDRQGKKLWIVAIDGRQPFYSEGVTFPELTKILLELGSDRALILDGGGSATLVVVKEGEMRSLNTPIHTRIPLRQRPIANHLGFYALP